LSILASIRFVAGDVAAGFELLSRGRTLGEKLQAADQDLLPALDLAAAESDACLRTGRLEEAERLALNGVALAPACGRERSFTAEILLANAVEALLERGDIDRASHLMATVPVDPDNESVWVRLTSWIEIDVVAGRVDSARDRMRRVTGIKDADLSLDRETSQLAVNVLLGGGEPGEAIDLVLDSGRRYVGTDEDLFCGELLVLGARAAADLADGARARRDQAGVADALTRLEQVEALAESMGGRPFTDHPYIVRIPSDRAQWHAERQRARGVIDPDAWCTSAEAWEGLGRPHRAAYAWWRCAETHLMSGAGAAAAAEPLRRGARLAAGFVPIMAAIDALARRAKIQLDRPSTAATHGDPDADEGSTRSEPIRVDPYGLTERERLVLALVAAGRTNTQIGAELFISPKTASVHVTNILRKLGVDNRTQAASTAERAGILA
jgi:DNA-binding CsgD family transcriptional regulator/sugar phosphate isomerase/epimerase